MREGSGEKDEGGGKRDKEKGGRETVKGTRQYVSFDTHREVEVEGRLMLYHCHGH